MLVFDRDNWPSHKGWAIATGIATVAAVVWYLVHGFSSGPWRWPSGASPPGLAFGILGGVIIAFEMLLWPRKSLWRGRRLGRTKIWMTAHIWLGLLTFPLLMLHGSFHFSLATSTLAAVIMWLLAVVVTSGLCGLVVQNVIPRLMWEQVPAETIHTQIGHILEQYADEAEQLVSLTCGGPADAPLSTGRVPQTDTAQPYLVVGAVRKVGRVQGKAVTAGFAVSWVAGSEPLRAFHRAQVSPYLEAKSGRGLPLSSTTRADALFAALKAQLRPEAHAAVNRIAELCDQRRQFDIQTRLHRWLHVWLGVHLPLSVALFALMLVHAVLALKYL
jgi:hypothetical protein